MKIHWIFRVVSLFNYQGCLFASLEATLLFYHNLFCLSSTFFKFFKLFCFSIFLNRCALTLRYFITSFAVCQVFFWSFLTFFFTELSQVCNLLVTGLWFLTASIFYHVLVCLSSTFFAFFQHRLTFLFSKFLSFDIFNSLCILPRCLLFVKKFFWTFWIISFIWTFKIIHSSASFQTASLV